MPSRVRRTPRRKTSTLRSAKTAAAERNVRRRTRPHVTSPHPALTVKDLLEAREAYQVHLMNLKTVVGTAIGLFLEKRELWKERTSNPDRWKPHDRLEPRTLANSLPTEDSWPSVLVFVNRWMTRAELRKPGNVDQLVPPRLYLPDGRIVPTCVIYVKEEEAERAPLANQIFPSGLLGGGYPVVTLVQEQEHLASVGCLVSDGDSVYALTNRHVTGEVRAGEPRREISSFVAESYARVGEADPNQVGKLPFAEVYPGWPGRSVLSNLDAGLVRVDDAMAWTSQVYGLGNLASMIDIHPNTLTFDLIGKPVRAFGGASGPLEGKVFGFFYRYKSIAGTDYVTDVLIGPRDRDRPLRTHPGDSGTLWCLEAPPEVTNGVKPKEKTALYPLALQWGGQRFSSPGATETATQLALGTFLSTVCRKLDVELVRAHNTGYREYWGKLGHFKIAAKALELVKNAKLKKLLALNRDRIAYDDKKLEGKLPTFAHPRTDFVPLADVADLVWRSTRGMDRANHFADMDQKGKGAFAGKTLLDLCKKDKNVDARVWGEFYDSIGTKSDKDRGALPFRVWQMYDLMVASLQKGKVAEFVCAGGLMSHYAGDACQPLHISQFHDGAEKEDKGVHSAYETQMLDGNRVDVVAGVNQKLGGWKATPEVKGGHAAAVRTVDLMRQAHLDLDPMDVIHVYRDVDKPKEMWPPLRKKTIQVLAKGAQNLAVLWESAWKEGGGAKIAASKIKAVEESKLRTLYNTKTFAPSMWLDDMAADGVGIVPGT